VKDIYNLSWIRSSIASLTYKAACKVLNTEPTYADKTDEVQDIGGNVILPTKEETYNGYHVDVGSLYPHMFCMANLTAEVNPENVSSKRKIWHGNEVFQVKGYYDITERHPLATYISEKLKERIHLKETDPKNPFIYTLKIFLNGLYGVIASGIFEKVHTKNAGYDCCYLGQEVQQLMKEMLEQFGFEIIQGDTDALDFIAKEGTENTKEYVQDCLNQITEVIKENFPFPVGTFKINIEYCFDYLMVPFSEEPIVGEDGKNLKKGNRLILERKGKKKNYLVIYKDKGETIVKLVGLPIIKDNATALGMKIYDDVLKPEIIKNMRAKFSASYIQKVINDYLKKPEIIELLSQEYKVKAANSYKNNCIQKQISQAYFNGNEGVIRLVKNSKVGKCGQGTKYATIEEATNAKLTSDELDLDKVNQELSPFVLFEEVKTPVEATEQPKTATSSQDNVKVEELPIQAPKKRGRKPGSKNKKPLDK
jgi:DNA polymerase elongation subunit (family B)